MIILLSGYDYYDEEQLFTFLIQQSIITQEKIVCSLTIIQCAKSAQGVLISKSSTENVLDAHSNVLLVITLQTARQIQHTGVQNEIVYANNMCYML